MVLPSSILDVMLFEIVTGGIVAVAFFARWIFEPDSEISNVQFVGELGGVLILLIKLILGDLILILSIISPKPHSQIFSITPRIFL